MKSFLSTLKKRVAHVALAFLVASSSLTGFGQLLLSQAAHATPAVAFEQGFETNTDGWITSGGYGSIVRSNSIPSASGNWHALASSEGYSTGPFSRLGGYGNVWTGQWESNVAVYLDPAWVSGTGFDYSVSATGSDGLHQRDFIFHVAKDVSTNSLLVAGTNNTNYAVRQDLETLNHHTITSAGWYNLQHVFRNNSGVLAVDLNLRDSEGNLLFTETRSDAEDTIPAAVGGNRYAWFTVANVNGGLAIDDVSRIAEPAPVTNITTGETFATIKAAIQDVDTANGNTLEIYGTLNVTENTNINKDVTIQGVAGATINVSGGNQVLTITANGVTVKDLTLVKTDKTTNNLIGIQANDVTIQNNTFTGQYIAGDGDVTRAMVVSPGRTNAVITGNTITNFRQPAYLDPLSTGAITNNHVTGTRGWVVSKDSNFTFTGNTWGTNSPVDIAIIVGHTVDPTPSLNNYTCKIPTIRSMNSNAAIDDQAPASLTTCPNTSPVVNFNTPTPADSTFVSGMVTGNVTATDDWGMGSYYVRFWKDAFEVAGGGTLLHGCQSAPGAFLLGKTQTVSCSYNTASLADGTKLVLSAQFLDGHIAWGMNKRMFTVDNTAPVITTKNATWNNPGVTFIASGSTISTVVNSQLRLFTAENNIDKVLMDGVEKWSGSWITQAGGIGLSWITSGTHTFQAVDKAGNLSNVITLTFDNAVPEVPTNLAWTTSGSVSTPSNGVTNDANGVASWSASASTDAHHYIYKYWNDIVGNQYKEATPWTNSPVSGTSLPGSFTEGEGVHYFSVAAVDHAGNVSAFSTPFKITYDRTAPTVTITPIDSTTDTTPEITGTVVDSDVGTVEVSLDNGASWQAATLTGTTWSYPVTTPLAVGSVTVLARATDEAGNTTNPVVSEVFTVAAVQGVQSEGSLNQVGGDTGRASFAGVNTDAVVLGTQDTNSEEEVALTSDSSDADKNAVAGTSDDKEDDSKGAWELVGLAWYWWLLVLAAIAGLWWLIIARKANTDKQ